MALPFAMASRVFKVEKPEQALRTAGGLQLRSDAAHGTLIPATAESVNFAMLVIPRDVDVDYYETDDPQLGLQNKQFRGTWTKTLSKQIIFLKGRFTKEEFLLWHSIAGLKRMDFEGVVVNIQNLDEEFTEFHEPGCLKVPARVFNHFQPGPHGLQTQKEQTALRLLLHAASLSAERSFQILNEIIDPV